MKETLSITHFYTVTPASQSCAAAAFTGFVPLNRRGPKPHRTEFRPAASSLVELARAHQADAPTAVFEKIVQAMIICAGGIAVGYWIHSMMEFAVRLGGV